MGDAIDDNILPEPLVRTPYTVLGTHAKKYKMIVLARLSARTY